MQLCNSVISILRTALIDLVEPSAHFPPHSYTPLHLTSPHILHAHVHPSVRPVEITKETHTPEAQNTSVQSRTRPIPTCTISKANARSPYYITTLVDFRWLDLLLSVSNLTYNRQAPHNNHSKSFECAFASEALVLIGSSSCLALSPIACLRQTMFPDIVVTVVLLNR